MTERERKGTRGSESESTETVEEIATDEQGEAITDRIDDILDEIDTVLEENAEEFVKNYVQKGGE
ncbi:MAG: ubiquitin-like protein Pup [bacterium]|nr:ubiquitin-like protein Pup [bacterium]MCP4968504.1 ubiquitin-like protein Pup [bacterium]